MKYNYSSRVNIGIYTFKISVIHGPCMHGYTHYVPLLFLVYNKCVYIAFSKLDL